MTCLSERPPVIVVVCEGETEETFVRRVLSVHLTQKTLKPFCLGGIEPNGYKKLVGGVRQWLRTKGITHVTTMIDLYRLPSDFPRKTQAPSDPYKKVCFLEEALAEEIRDARFIPYIMLHEFEALLLTKTGLEIIRKRARVGKSDRSWKELQMDLARVRTPERLNDDANSHPSARIKKIWPRFKKTTDGVGILEQVPWEELCTACPHFGDWIRKLEAL
jgi:hypothetical protein